MHGSLKRLGLDHAPLYYAHRRDPLIPIEDVAGTMGRMIDEGLIGGYGRPKSPPRPCAGPMRNGPAWPSKANTRSGPACRNSACCKRPPNWALPLSPSHRSRAACWAKPTRTPHRRCTTPNYRLQIPRFAPDNYARNQTMLDHFKTFARARGWNVAAAAIAWVLDRAEIARILPPGFAHGDRYSLDQMRTIQRYC